VHPFLGLKRHSEKLGLAAVTARFIFNDGDGAVSGRVHSTRLPSTVVGITPHKLFHRSLNC